MAAEVVAGAADDEEAAEEVVAGAADEEAGADESTSERMLNCGVKFMLLGS